MSSIVWNDKDFLIMQTAEADGAFMPEGLYQIYKHTGADDEWERWPEGGTKNGIVWFKTLEAAKEKVEALKDV